MARRKPKNEPERHSITFWFPRRFKGTKEEILKLVEEAIDKRASKARVELGKGSEGYIVEFKMVAYDEYCQSFEIEFNVEEDAE